MLCIDYVDGVLDSRRTGFVSRIVAVHLTKSWRLQGPPLTAKRFEKRLYASGSRQKQRLGFHTHKTTLHRAACFFPQMRMRPWRQHTSECPNMCSACSRNITATSGAHLRTITSGNHICESGVSRHDSECFRRLWYSIVFGHVA